jgi:hypothetical protein
VSKYNDLEVQGHLNDGWAYAIELAGGRKIRYSDHDDLATVRARLEALEREIVGHYSHLPAGASDQVIQFRWSRAKLEFSGARSMGEQDVVNEAMEPQYGPDGKILQEWGVGKIDGKGFVLAAQVVAIGYWGEGANLVSDQALDAVRAFQETNAEVAEEKLDEIQAADFFPKVVEGEASDTDGADGTDADGDADGAEAEATSAAADGTSTTEQQPIPINQGRSAVDRALGKR